MNIFLWLKRLWDNQFIECPSCDHTKNFKAHSYYDEKGTPMMEFVCYDCGYIDKGHVYADETTWIDAIFICKDGITTQIQ